MSNEFANDPVYARRVKESLDDTLAVGGVNEKYSIRVSTNIMIRVDQMAKAMAIPTRTDVFRGILVAAKTDLIDRMQPSMVETFGKTLTAIA